MVWYKLPNLETVACLLERQQKWSLGENATIEELQNKVISFEKEITTLKKQNEDKDLVIKNLQEKSEEYRNIVEKSAISGFTISLIRFSRLSTVSTFNNTPSL